MAYNCKNCGKQGYGRPGQGPASGEEIPAGWVTTGFLLGRKVFCSNRCKDEFISRNESKNENSNSQVKNETQRSPQREGKSFAQVLADKEKEEQNRKYVEESNAKLFDNIKKIILYKKNKEAKELHLKLQEIETEIIIAIKRENNNDANNLLKKLKHNSNFFLPNTNTTYNNYWTTKREEYLSDLEFKF